MINKFLASVFLIFCIGCASHPIKHNPNLSGTPVTLKPTSNILILTYMSNTETQFQMELMNTKHTYYVAIKDTEALSKLLPASFNENVNAKLIPDSVLFKAPTYVSLVSKYKTVDGYHNLNQGVMIMSKEDLTLLIPNLALETKADIVLLLRLDYLIKDINSIGVSLDGIVLDPSGKLSYSNASNSSESVTELFDDQAEGAGEKVGNVLNALSLNFVHKRTKGFQPAIVKNTKVVLDKFMADFALASKVEKKKKK